MNADDLAACIPRDKHDHAAVARAAAAGFPALNPILGDLLEWIQDANWPVAPQIAALLTNADAKIVAPVRAILTGTDGMWKYWTIELLIARASPDVFQDLCPDLERLATAPTRDDRECEADQAARSVLALRLGSGV